MIFLTYGEIIESLASGLYESNLVATLPELEDQLGMANELLLNFLDPSTSIYDFKQNYRVDPIGVFLHLLTQSAMSDALATAVFNNSKLLARIGNEHVLALDSLTTSIDSLKDLSRITSIYLGRKDKDTFVYRVYPAGSSSQSRSGLTGNVDSVEKLAAATIMQLNEGLGTSRKIAQSNIDRIAKVLPVNGKAKIELDLQVNKLMNALKFDLGTTQGLNKENNSIKIAKIESKDMDGNPVMVADMSKTVLNLNQVSSGLISLAPTIAKKLTLHLETNKNTESISILDLAPMKIKYKGNGKISEQEIVVPRPITSISIIDEDYDLSDTAREYFEAIHEIQLEEQEEWIKIKPRNADNYESTLPELILIGSQYALPGVSSIQTDKPISKFKYRGSFKRKNSIPADVLLDIYARRLNRNNRKIIVPLSSVGNEDSIVSLPTYPLEKPKAYMLNQGVITDDFKDGVLLGNNLDSTSLYLPEALFKVKDRTRLQVTKNGTELTWTDTNPSSLQFQVENDGKLNLDSNSRLGEEVRAFLLPEKLNVVPSNTTDPFYTFALEHAPGFLDGNLRIFYKTYPASNTETFATQNLDKAFDDIYRISLSHTGIESLTLKALDINLNDVTSSVFINETIYNSGIENTSNGDYSLDSDNGVLYFRLNTFSKLTVAVSYSYSEEIEATKDIVPYLNIKTSNSFTTDKSFSFTRLTETVPAGSDSFTIGNSLSIWNDWSVVENSIKINGYSRNKSISNLQFVENLIVKKTSNNGTVSVFNLPLAPVDSNHEINVDDNNNFVTTRGAAGNGGWTLNNNTSIYVNDSSNELDYIIVSYTFKKTEQVDITKDFTYYSNQREIEFGESTTEELIVSYDIQSYYAKYLISTEINTESILFDSDERKEIKIKKNVLADADASNDPTKASKKLLVVYPEIKQDSARNAETMGNDPSDYLTVLPKHIDIEVGTN